MTVIALCKVLMLGCGGALGYYFVISYVFHYFPMPIFLKADALLKGWHLKRLAENKNASDFLWRMGKGFLNTLLLGAWWLVFAGFAYILYSVLHYYFPEVGSLFWPYYGLAIALPAIWVLVRFIAFFKKKPVEEIKIALDTRPLIEQVAKG
ncbi:MAG: hypothetical protein ACRBFS_05715 [Aureispira sp.]